MSMDCAHKLFDAMSMEPTGTTIPIATHTPTRSVDPTPPNEPHPASLEECKHEEASGGAESASLGMTDARESWRETRQPGQATNEHPH